MVVAGRWSPITGAALFLAPLVLPIFPGPRVLAAPGLNLLFQFGRHAGLIGRLPSRGGCVFNTPAHHRVHHASSPEYLDCKHGGMPIVFGRLFGSLRADIPKMLARYGLTNPLRGCNPVRVEFPAWRGLSAALRRSRGPEALLLRVLSGPPGRGGRLARFRSGIAVVRMPVPSPPPSGVMKQKPLRGNAD